MPAISVTIEHSTSSIKPMQSDKRNQLKAQR